MANRFFAHHPAETEDTITYGFAGLLRQKGMDATPQYAVGGGRHHDIHIRVDNLAVAVEAKKGQGGAAFKNAVKSANGRIDDNTADAAIALCYPNGCNAANVGASNFMWAICTRRTTAAHRDFGGIDDFVSELRHIREYIGDPERLAKKLSESLDAAALKLPFAMQQTIAESVSLPPDKDNKYYNAAKRALLVVANTVMFHARLESYFAQWHRQGKFKDEAKPLTVQQCLDSGSACVAFNEAWRAILKIDYKLIFQSARCIVQYSEAEGAVREVAKAALEIAADPASLRHDLLGGLFHRALDSAKYDGSFYTTPASAVLLAGLSVSGKNSDYCILDPSCGTGTLLMSAAERYRDLMATGGKDEKLHRRIVENVIHGIDINITATQMAATTLGIISPKTDFAEINIHQARFGIHGGIARLGALDYLAGNGAPSLVPMNPDGRHIDSDIEEQMPEYKDTIDLVIMNPPYTRADLRHNNMSREDKRAMSEREKAILGRTAAHQSSNGNNFIALADALIKNEGKFAAILPLVTATAITALGTRKFIADNYNIEYIIVPHDPKRFWFSGGTAISEMMVIASRRAKGDKPKAAKVIALLYNPETPNMARRLARLIAKGKDGGDLERHSITTKQLAAGDWTAVQFASPRLLRDFYKLRDGKLFKVMELGDADDCIIVSGKQTTGTLNHSESLRDNSYPALWGNDADYMITMSAKPDCYAYAKKGNEALLRRLYKESGRLKFPLKLRLSTARVCAALVSRDAIGGWWESVKVAKSQEKPLCLFANSSFGVLGLLGVKNAHTFSRPEVYKAYLAKLPVPVLTKKQAEKMSASFDELSKQTLSPLPEMADDEVRVKIDHAVADALGINREVIDRLREELAAEPCISGKRGYALAAL